jgi:leucyl-tRNA synthetase
VVEKREIPGYYLKITDYAEELLDRSAPPARLARARQAHAGELDRARAIGVRFAFPHETSADGASGQLIGDGRMYVFTTRADTIMGVTFCAVGPEHPLATLAAVPTRHSPPSSKNAPRRHDRSRAGHAGKEGHAHRPVRHHPLTGDKVEVWVGNYVLMSYGDGAVMGVPAHDERDFAFAKKYGLPSPGRADVKGQAYAWTPGHDWYGDKQRGVTINSGKYDGWPTRPAVDAVAADLAAKGLGEKKTTWRLRDWGVSRQRYWGTPIPIIHCDEHGAVPVPEKDLPVVLPQDCVPDGSGNPLHKHEGFHAGVTCPVCGKPAAARPTPWTPLWIRPGTSCATATRTTTKRWSPKAPTTGCRWTSTSAASSTPSCTCCTRASGPR